MYFKKPIIFLTSQLSSLYFHFNILLVYYVPTSNPQDGDTEYDTVIINPASVTRHDHTIEGANFHLVLKMSSPVADLLQSRKGGDSRTLHFVLDSSPCPKGALLGLLGQQLPSSPPQSKINFRVDVSADTIQICGKTTTIVSTPLTQTVRSSLSFKV